MKLVPKYDEKAKRLEISYDEDALRSELEEVVSKITLSGKTYDYFTFKGSWVGWNGHDWLEGEDCYLSGVNEPYLEWKRRHDGDGCFEFDLDRLAESTLTGVRFVVTDLADWLVKYRDRHYYDEAMRVSLWVEAVKILDDIDCDVDDVWCEPAIDFEYSWAY